MLTSISAAILIDCWDLKTPPTKILHRNILNFLNNNEHIKTVILASYNCWTERYNQSIWWKNNVDFFSKNQPLRSVRDMWHIQNEYYAYSPNATPFDEEHTDPLILSYLNENKFQIAMTETWELTQYLLENPHIKNLYVCGASWSDCVKVRPLGYKTLKELPNINVLANRLCVHDDYPGKPADYPNIDADSSWHKIANDTYQYVI